MLSRMTYILGVVFTTYNAFPKIIDTDELSYTLNIVNLASASGSLVQDQYI